MVLPDAPAAKASGNIASIIPRLESTTHRIGTVLQLQAWPANRSLSIFDQPSTGISRSIYARQIVFPALASSRLRSRRARWAGDRPRRGPGATARGTERECGEPRAATRRPLCPPRDSQGPRGRRRDRGADLEALAAVGEARARRGHAAGGPRHGPGTGLGHADP